MDMVLIIILWFVVGYASALFLIGYEEKELRVIDLFIAIVCGLLGPVMILVVLLAVIRRWGKSAIWKKKEV